jgi:cation:H+ antiporter
MSLMAAVGLVVLGLAILTLGGDLLVRGATSIAKLAGLTPAVIGLTIVAMGTSLPELVVSVIASLEGRADLSVGNVVGSNIFNISLIMGVSALVAQLPIRGQVVKLEWPIMALATVITIALAWDGLIDRIEAGALFISLLAFTAYMIRLARVEVTALEREELGSEVARMTLSRDGLKVTLAIGATLAGIGFLVVGGKMLVDGAVRLAQLAGWTERVIGLTIVAAGTSAPELATSVMAALRKESDIAIANLIGSNIFNLLGILGVAGLLLPLEVSPGMLASDVWWMLGTTLLLFLLMVFRKALSRLDGLVLTAAYGLYLWFLL